MLVGAQHLRQQVPSAHSGVALGILAHRAVLDFLFLIFFGLFLLGLAVACSRFVRGRFLFLGLLTLVLVRVIVAWFFAAGHLV